MAVRGAGYSIVDELGRELIDLNNNFTALIHGHAHPAVVSAGQEALARGASYGLPNLSEVRHARTLLERLPAMEQVRYANSGTEAVMAALRLARAHTGRDKVVMLRRAYHGLSDAVLPAGGDAARRGIPAGVDADTILVAVDDVDALEATLREQGEQIAAVLIDLIPNRAGLVALSDQFVRRARALTEELGIVLIADEVISLRLAHGGFAAARGVEPDLMTTGKLIGGGLPVGALLGRAEIMGRLDPHAPDSVEQGGTFTGNPVTMESGIATLQLLDEHAIARLNDLGERARARLVDRLEGRSWEVRGAGSLLRPYPVGDGPPAPVRHRALWWAAYERGVLLLPNGLAALSTPMTADVVEHAVDCIADAIDEVDARDARA
jgi:glutamate-1-semialdehyde 2,1-aminomutase